MIKRLTPGGRNLSLKTISVIFILGVAYYVFSIYFSDKNVSERELVSMLRSGNEDILVLRKYLNHHDQKVDVDYDRALMIAAKLDQKYLDKAIQYYVTGQLILNVSTANYILEKIPSDSIHENYAAGRIYSTNEFGRYDIDKAVLHLQYSAMRRDKNAAADLSRIYSRYNCYVEAITWAREANKRESISKCTELPVNIDLLSGEDFSATIYNEKELVRAKKDHRVPILKSSQQCIFIK